MKHSKFLIAALLLLLCVADLIWWFTITAKDISFEAMKLEYLAIFPAFLQNNLLLTLVMMACLIAAALLFMQSRREKSLKFMANGGMVLSFTLAFWQLFSLM